MPAHLVGRTTLKAYAVCLLFPFLLLRVLFGSFVVRPAHLLTALLCVPPMGGGTSCRCSEYARITVYVAILLTFCCRGALCRCDSWGARLRYVWLVALQCWQQRSVVVVVACQRGYQWTVNAHICARLHTRRLYTGPSSCLEHTCTKSFLPITPWIPTAHYQRTRYRSLYALALRIAVVLCVVNIFSSHLHLLFCHLSHAHVCDVCVTSWVPSHDAFLSPCIMEEDFSHALLHVFVAWAFHICHRIYAI